MRLFVMVVVAALSLTACKKRSEANDPELAFAKMGEFRDKMCACKDKACTDKVQDEMNVWSAEDAKMRGDNPPKPSEADIGKMQDIGTRYGECMARAMGGGVPEEPAPTPPTSIGTSGEQVVAKFQEFVDRACACTTVACADSVTREISSWTWRGGDKPPTAAQLREIRALTEKTTACIGKARRAPLFDADGFANASEAPLLDADAIVRHTYSGLGKYVVSAIRIDYVRANGGLDRKYGKATFVLGIASPPAPSEDPDRPLGAPIEEPAPPPDVSGQSCPQLVWTKGIRAKVADSCTLAKAITRPKCSVVEVWRRAIAAKAPAEGLARLEYQNGIAPAWTFAIDDAPRKVKFRYTVADTCDPTIERPL